MALHLLLIVTKVVTIVINIAVYRYMDFLTIVFSYAVYCIF